MRTALVGAVESTRTALETMLREGVPPTALVTLPLSKAARHSDYVDLRPLAEQSGVRVIEASDINAPDALQQLRDFQPDYILVIGWSQICRREFLSIPTLGCIGYHPAALPKNRGRAVIPWTILQRLAKTGSTLFWLDEGVDSGDILMQVEFSVAPDETAATLYGKHLDFLHRMLYRALPILSAGNAPRRRQNHSRATYCAKRTAAAGLIDWSWGADSIWTLIRAAGHPYPGAFTFYKDKKLIVWQADFAGKGPYWGLRGQIQALSDAGVLVQCGDRQHVLLKTIQFEGEQQASANHILKIHDKLGIDWLGFYQRKGVVCS